MKQKIRAVTQNPAFKNSLMQLKPKRSVLGFLGVVLFFILPEIVAFVWNEEIVTFAKEGISSSPSYFYDALLFLFDEGGSWFNLGFGFALLVWLFF